MAAHVTAESEGAFDVTAGAIIKAWGFFRGPRRVPSDAERAAALERVGMRHVVLDPETRSVRYLCPGLEINLGSIGKGYALDRAAAVVRGRGNLPGALLHGGHSSVYAIGTEPGDERGWAVGIGHPWDAGRRVALLRLRDRALGTSAATHRHLEHEGRKLGHVLDPRTGWPAEGIALASAVAPTAAEADALATAFYVRGADWTRAYCGAHPDVGAVLLPEGESAPLLVGLARELAEPLAA
jgi:thiamine biosynthesis lipoprotein